MLIRHGHLLKIEKPTAEVEKALLTVGLNDLLK